MADAVAGLTRLLNRFITIQGRARDMTPAMQAVGTYMIGSVARTFRAGGRPKWTGLAASTIAARRRGKGKGGVKILIDSATLMNSMSSIATANEVSAGTNMIYGPRQHFGYPGGSGRGHSRTPARPFLVFQDEDGPAIETICNRFVMGK